MANCKYAKKIELFGRDSWVAKVFPGAGDPTAHLARTASQASQARTAGRGSKARRASWVGRVRRDPRVRLA